MATCLLRNFFEKYADFNNKDYYRIIKEYRNIKRNLQNMINKELIKRLLSTLILIPVVSFFVIEGDFLFNFFIVICFFITSYEWHKMRKTNLII